MSGQRERWEAEYRSLRGIPTSFSTVPSRVMPWFKGVLERAGLSLAGTYLDVGSGGGRNAAFCVQSGCTVVALEPSAAALDNARALQTTLGAGKLRLVRGGIGRSLPFRDGVFDGALDITVMDNVLSREGHRAYAAELTRVLKPGGVLLLYFFAAQDEYYRQFVTEEREGLLHLTDPHNGIESVLMPREYVLDLFRESMAVIEKGFFEFEDEMYSRSYLRRLHAVVFRKK